MAEIDTEEQSCAYATSLGWRNRKLQYVNRNGAPDRMFFRRGIIFFVEFKDWGKTPQPHQKRELGRMESEKILVNVIDNFSDFKDYIDRFDRPIVSTFYSAWMRFRQRIRKNAGKKKL